MKALHALVISSLCLFLSGQAVQAKKKEAKSAPEALVMKVDPANSKLEWTGAKITKDKHNGTIAISEGTVKFEGDKLLGGEFTVDMKSIVNLDLKDQGYNKKLVDHLKSDDFFAVDKHATAKLVIEEVQTGEAGKAIVKGDLTIRGKTQPVNFPAEIKMENGKAMAMGKLVFDRTKFDVKYNSGNIFKNLGDKAINDEVELSFTLVASK
jgi:polyisoprenoid-binding protein YceI